MAITHTQTVTNLTVLNDGTDVVSEVTIKTVSVDDSDPSTLTIQNEENFNVDTSGGTSASGFVPYSSLTEDDVKSWLSTQIAERKAKAEAWIESKKNPPTPPEVNKTLPWS